MARWAGAAALRSWRLWSLRFPWKLLPILLVVACERVAPPGVASGAAPAAFVPIRTWQLSPSYASDWTKPIDQQHFAPEEGLGGAGDFSWLPVEAAADGTVDLRRYEPLAVQGTIYARTKLEGAAARRIELEVESDDGFELFLNQKHCAMKQTLRKLGEGMDRVELDLLPGKHDLLLKFMKSDATHAVASWGFRVRSRQTTGG